MATKKAEKGEKSARKAKKKTSAAEGRKSKKTERPEILTQAEPPMREKDKRDKKNKKDPKEKKAKKDPKDKKDYSVRVHVEPALGVKVEALLEQSGFSVQNAVRAFLERVADCGGLPFEVPKPEAPEPVQGAWCAQTEQVFQEALDEIDAKYGNALRNLAN